MRHLGMRWLCSALLLLTPPGLTGQADPASQGPTKKRSLADGLVRQRIERDALRPPTMRTGLEMAAGKGPMVLLVRDANGKLTATVLPRGRGKHGPAAKPPSLELGEEVVIEEVEEVEVLPAAPPAKKPPAPRKPEPRKPAPQKPAAEKPAATPKAKGPARVTLDVSEHGPTIQLADSDKVVANPVDRPALRRKLQAQLSNHRDLASKRHLWLDVSVDVMMRDVLTFWEVARSAGYETLLLSPNGRRRPPTNAEQDLMEGLTERFRWTARKGTGFRIFDGELLILLNGPASVREVLPLVFLCAQHGIWQISFVGQSPDRKTRFKLPVHLPNDHG